MKLKFQLLLVMFLAVSCGDDSENPVDLGTDTDGTDAESNSDSDGGDLGDLPTDLDDGAACSSDEQCTSGTCLGEEDGFPDGYCSNTACEAREDCSGVGRACLRGEFNGNFCVELCGDDVDCREGYECRGAGSGGYCYPAFASDVLGVSCETTLLEEEVQISPFFPPADLRQVNFEVSDRADSFAVTLFNRDEEMVLPITLQAPTQGELSLLDEYGYFIQTSPLAYYISPLMFPAGPDWTEWVEPGTYTLDVATTGDHICWYLLENEEPGTVVDLNFYFVGVRGLNSQNADRDSDFQEMLAEFSTTMAQSDISLGQARYYDVTGDVEDAFALISTEAEIFELMRLSRTPGQTREDLLSVNVFFIRDFRGEMFSTLGVAPGVPAVMGIHGQSGTGLIFSAANFGSASGNILVGQVLAHELGHYLGLEHTTEIAVQDNYDHLEDTPQCPDIRRESLESCPDYSNLMFPIASFRDTVLITADQGLVLQSNPLVRSE